MRVVQPEGTRGSLKWIQRAVASNSDRLRLDGFPVVEWLSPLEDDDYAEYRDGSFLELVGAGQLRAALADFWPRRGPQWDALGRAGDRVVLVEAKAHLSEFLSPPTQASPSSREMIEKSFDLVRADLGVRTETRWTEILFQYANRIAHLWFLRANGVPAELVFVSFLNDADMKGPERAETWNAAFAVADHALGLPAGHRLAKHIHHVHPDIREL
ncbi:hypothetical protein HKCCE2091_07230 [Rhodobacterales bacterium HKCCE2091]|nr:hypothetical protein [Rhodobacterales bacterium HKCCE2091]